MGVKAIKCWVLALPNHFLSFFALLLFDMATSLITPETRIKCVSLTLIHVVNTVLKLSLSHDKQSELCAEPRHDQFRQAAPNRRERRDLLEFWTSKQSRQ